MIWIVNLKVLQNDSNFFRVSETLSCTRYNHSFCSSSISNFSAKFPAPTSKKKNPLQRSWCHVLLVVLGMLPRINSDLHPEISREQQHRWVACSPVHLWEMFFHGLSRFALKLRPQSLSLRMSRKKKQSCVEHDSVQIGASSRVCWKRSLRGEYDRISPELTLLQRRTFVMRDHVWLIW